MKKIFVNNSGYGLFGTFMATLHYLNNMQEISMVTVKGYKSTATVMCKRNTGILEYKNTGIQDDSEYL